MGPRTVAEVESRLTEGVEDLHGADLGGGIDATNSIDDLGSGEKVGGFGRCGSRAIGGLKGSHVETDVCDGLLGSIVILCHC